MFRAHYAEFDKTMRHENANSIRCGQERKKKKIAQHFFPSLFLIDLKTYWVTGLLGQQLTWKKKSEAAIIKVFVHTYSKA